MLKDCRDVQYWFILTISFHASLALTISFIYRSTDPCIYGLQLRQAIALLTTATIAHTPFTGQWRHQAVLAAVEPKPTFHLCHLKDMHHIRALMQLDNRIKDPNVVHV